MCTEYPAPLCTMKCGDTSGSVWSSRHNVRCGIWEGTVLVYRLDDAVFK